MDEELSIIDSNNRNQKIKNFFLKNKKIFLLISFLIFCFLIVFFGYNEYKDIKKKQSQIFIIQLS